MGKKPTKRAPRPSSKVECRHCGMVVARRGLQSHIAGETCYAGRRSREMQARGFERVAVVEPAVARTCMELQRLGYLAATGESYALSRWKPGTKGEAGDRVRELWMFPWAATIMRVLLTDMYPWDRERHRVKRAFDSLLAVDPAERLELAQRIATTWGLASMAK